MHRSFITTLLQIEPETLRLPARVRRQPSAGEHLADLDVELRRAAKAEPLVQAVRGSHERARVQTDGTCTALLRAHEALAHERLADPAPSRVAAYGERSDRGPARRPALERRARGVRIEADGSDEEAFALRDDQLRVGQAASGVDNLAEVALPRLGREVRPELAVGLGEQRRDRL